MDSALNYTPPVVWHGRPINTWAAFHTIVKPGRPLLDGLQESLDAAIAKLPIPKVMRYPNPAGGYYNDIAFVRPAGRCSRRSTRIPTRFSSLAVSVPVRPPWLAC